MVDKTMTKVPPVTLPGEAPPSPPRIYVDGKPVYLLEKGSLRLAGKDAQRHNIFVAEIMAHLVKTTFGPTGMYKLILDKEGTPFITSDGATILSNLEINHPIAKLIADATKSLDNETGDGTVSTVILSAEILSKCKEMLLEKKIRSTTLVSGCRRALLESLRLLKNEAIQIDIENRGALENIVMTFLSRKMSPKEREYLAKIIVEAALKVAEKTSNGYMINPKDIDVRTRIGCWMTDSQLIDGAAFYKEKPHPDMPSTVQDAKIAVLRNDLTIYYKGGPKTLRTFFEITAPEKINAYPQLNLLGLKEIIDNMIDTGANVIIVEKGVALDILGELARRNILVIRRFDPDGLERMAKAVGATAVDVRFLRPEHLGHAKLVEERNFGGQPWFFIEGCENPKSVTILIRGLDEFSLNETERCVRDALKTVSCVLKEPKMVAGGGAIELELALGLRHMAKKLGIREQLVVEGFSQALESIPATLVENSGADLMDNITELRSMHALGRKWVGFDGHNKCAVNMVEKGIYDPLFVKRRVLETATQTAIAILRVDDYIAGRKLSKPEYYRKKREKKTSPEEVKKLEREYGIHND
jgi:chaperonin GroEL (HSP60 family)